MAVRRATRQDLPAISAVLASAFHSEDFTAKVLPFRNEFPEDYLRAWTHHVSEEWWNYHKVFIVTTDQNKKVTGVAAWAREGPAWDETTTFWNISKFNPGRLVSRLLKIYHSLHRALWPNRASIRPTTTNPRPLAFWNWVPAIMPYVAPYFIPPPPSVPLLQPAAEKKEPSYHELATLAVDPAHQSQGQGRLLCAWGLGIARQRGLPAVVVAADGKERFYRRCGFELLVGWASDGEGNPFRALGVRGGAVLWTREDGEWGREKNP